MLEDEESLIIENSKDVVSSKSAKEFHESIMEVKDKSEGES